MNLIVDAKTGGNIRLFSLARYALVEALRVIGISPGQKVLIPAFICRDLLASLHAVGAEPAFYSVERSLAALSLPVLRDVAAIVAVNYFGFPQRLETFRAYCAEHGAALIEDNAHGFLSRDEQGTPLGSRTDLGIVSMRKTFALPDGAALLVNRKEWIDRLHEPLACREDALPASFVVKRALRQVQNATGILARSFSEQMVRYIRRIQTGHPLPLSRPESECEIPGSPAIHCESCRMLDKIDMAHEVERRRTLYRRFERDLRNLDIQPVFGDLPPGVAPYGYVFRASESGAAAVAQLAHRRGFNCFSWPDLPATIIPVAPEFYRNVWWVNFLC